MIENIKDLEKLLKLCRKQGVTEINLGTVAFKLGDLPERPMQSVSGSDEDIEEKYADFPDGPLTQEELTFFANGGLPSENPYRDIQ